MVSTARQKTLKKLTHSLRCRKASPSRQRNGPEHMQQRACTYHSLPIAANHKTRERFTRQLRLRAITDRGTATSDASGRVPGICSAMVAVGTQPFPPLSRRGTGCGPQFSHLWPAPSGCVLYVASHIVPARPICFTILPQRSISELIKGCNSSRDEPAAGTMPSFSICSRIASDPSTAFSSA